MAHPVSQRSSAVLRDPVCWMKVDPAKAAAKVEHDGEMYYFCSVFCAKRFRIYPELYADANQAPGVEGGP